MGIGRMSASRVLLICGSFSGIVANLQERGLPEVPYTYILLDAAYIKCRDEDRILSCVFVTAIGADADYYSRLLGLGCY